MNDNVCSKATLDDANNKDDNEHFQFYVKTFKQLSFFVAIHQHSLKKESGKNTFQCLS